MAVKAIETISEKVFDEEMKYELAKENMPITLSVSLHAPNNEIRDQIMPINKAYPLEVLRDSIKSYKAKRTFYFIWGNYYYLSADG